MTKLQFCNADDQAPVLQCNGRSRYVSYKGPKVGPIFTGTVGPSFVDRSSNPVLRSRVAVLGRASPAARASLVASRRGLLSPPSAVLHGLPLHELRGSSLCREQVGHQPHRLILLLQEI